MTLRSPRGMAVALAAAFLLAVIIMARDDESAAGPAGARRRAAETTPAPDVDVTGLKLERLQQTRSALGEPARDPFRFRARPAPPRAPAATAPVAPPAAPRPTAPAGPPPPPPIPLRFIGLMDAPTQAGRVAIMSDGRGNIFYGREGATIEGRYRVLKVGPDAVEISHVDGRGRQTIRLSGQ